MKKYDRLIIRAGESIGLRLTYSDNHGGWSRGEPYTKTDFEFNPILHNEDALELAEKLELDIPFGRLKLSVQKARLYITLMAVKIADQRKLKANQK